MPWRHAAVGGLFNLFVAATLNGCSFLIGLWAAKLLGTEEFGALQLARTILGYLVILPPGGYRRGLVRAAYRIGPRG